eukprot:GHVQ01015958.1.p1 GENE.GHVQ01015958.1~~GHVQ01015958.1.p1  ORF type:complete len:154 (-),score=21.06 GHVQ01015958.1:1496-1957(-)
MSALGVASVSGIQGGGRVQKKKPSVATSTMNAEKVGLYTREELLKLIEERQINKRPLVTSESMRLKSAAGDANLPKAMDMSLFKSTAGHAELPKAMDIQEDLTASQQPPKADAPTITQDLGVPQLPTASQQPQQAATTDDDPMIQQALKNLTI